MHEAQDFLDNFSADPSAYGQCSVCIDMEDCVFDISDEATANMHATIRSRRQDPGVGLVARILRTRRPHSPPKHDVLRSTDVLHSTEKAHRGQRFTSPGPGSFQKGQLALHSGASRLQETNQHSWN